MTVIRRKKREKKVGVKLFNELLFEFITEESKSSTEHEDILAIDPDTLLLYAKLNDKWRAFCNKMRNNNKKLTQFKIKALEESLEKHLARRRQAVWAKHLVSVMYLKYDQHLTIEEANENYNESEKAEVIADQLMTKIYKMHLIEIPDINYKVEIPSTLPELTGDQFVYFAGLLKKLYEKEITLDDLKTRMVLKFLNVETSENAYEKLSAMKKAGISENVSKIAEKLDYFFTLDGDKLNLNLGFTKNFVKKLKLPFWFNLHGPEDALTDINFQEYKDASNYYRAYVKDDNAEDLNRMIAVLYRPKFFKWKLPYWPGQMEKRARRIGKLPFAIRFAIFLFMTACEDFLKHGTINIDGGDIKLFLLYEQTLKEKQKNIKIKYESNTGLAGVALSLAGTGIFGPIEKVYKQNLYDVLLLLYKQRIEYLNQLENS